MVKAEVATYTFPRRTFPRRPLHEQPFARNGARGIAPKIALRYNSGTVDDLAPGYQGDIAGLGWTLDVGGFILRDTKNTTTTADDTFKLVFGGVSYDLVLIDSTQNIYHTKDET